MELSDFVTAFAEGLKRADALQPMAVNKRSGVAFQAGIGPHSEKETIRLAIEHAPTLEGAAVHFEVPYPAAPRSRCDVVLDGDPAWAVEMKMLRLLGDNGKPNDNMLMHILSPYPEHRSAVTDCGKLLASGFALRKSIVIFGYDHAERPLQTAIEAFYALASLGARLDPVTPATFGNLVHPVHASGAVYGWEIDPLDPARSSRSKA